MAGEIRVRNDQRVSIVGKTGSGKSFFARYLCQGLTRLVALDPKATMDAAAWGLEPWHGRAAQRLAQGDPGRYLVRPDVDHPEQSWADAMDAVWQAGDCVLYVDELYRVVEGRKPPKLLTALYTMGRERGIGVWAAVQRPTWVPLFTLSESQWLFIFRLNLRDDRRRMAELSSEVVERPIPDPHGFWSYFAEWDEPLYSSGLVVKARKQAARPGSR